MPTLIVVPEHEFLRAKAQAAFWKFMAGVLCVSVALATAALGPTAYDNEQQRRVEAVRITNR
jgi:uncharacterized membrane protein YdcZ (DUF606 family)